MHRMQRALCDPSISTNTPAIKRACAPPLVRTGARARAACVHLTPPKGGHNGSSGPLGHGGSAQHTQPKPPQNVKGGVHSPPIPTVGPATAHVTAEAETWTSLAYCASALGHGPNVVGQPGTPSVGLRLPFDGHQLLSGYQSTAAAGVQHQKPLIPGGHPGSCS